MFWVFMCVSMLVLRCFFIFAICVLVFILSKVSLVMMLCIARRFFSGGRFIWLRWFFMISRICCFCASVRFRFLNIMFWCGSNLFLWCIIGFALVGVAVVVFAVWVRLVALRVRVEVINSVVNLRIFYIFFFSYLLRFF